MIATDEAMFTVAAATGIVAGTDIDFSRASVD